MRASRAEVRETFSTLKGITSMQVVKPHPGRMFARCAKSLAIATGEPGAAIGYTHGQNWTDAYAIEAHHKAVLTGVSLANLPATAVGLDLSAAVRPRTVWGQLPGVRRVPLRVRMLIAIGGTSGAAFVGEGQPIPVARMDLAGEELPPLKVSALTVATMELVRSSTPNAEDTLTEDIVAACAQGADLAFLDPDNAGAARVSPASITYGIAQRVSSGSDVANIYADLGLMAQDLVAAGSTLASAAWIIRPQTLVSMAGMHDSSGALAFPGLSVLGGTLMGLPVIAAGNLPQPGSPAASFIALVDGSQVVVGDDAQAEVAISTTAALQMDDAPTNATADGTATALVSLYQAEAIGIRASLWMNWRLRRPYVSVLSGVAY